MKILSIIALAVLLSAAAFIPNICLRVSFAQRSAAPEANQNEPSIERMKVPDAAKLREQARGRVLIVNFWPPGVTAAWANSPNSSRLIKITKIKVSR